MLKIKAVVVPQKQNEFTIKPRICIIKVNTINFDFMLTLVPFKEVNL